MEAVLVSPAHSTSSVVHETSDWEVSFSDTLQRSLTSRNSASGGRDILKYLAASQTVVGPDPVPVLVGMVNMEPGLGWTSHMVVQPLSVAVLVRLVTMEPDLEPFE